jgi:hypothetical protein
MTLLQDQDQVSLMTNPSILVMSADRRQQPVVPFKLGQQIIRREIPCPYPPGVQPPQSGLQQTGATDGTPIAAPLGDKWAMSGRQVGDEWAIDSNGSRIINISHIEM